MNSAYYTIIYGCSCGLWIEFVDRDPVPVINTHVKPSDPLPDEDRLTQQNTFSMTGMQFQMFFRDVGLMAAIRSGHDTYLDEPHSQLAQMSRTSNACAGSIISLGQAMAFIDKYTVPGMPGGVAWGSDFQGVINQASARYGSNACFTARHKKKITVTDIRYWGYYCRNKEAKDYQNIGTAQAASKGWWHQDCECKGDSRGLTECDVRQASRQFQADRTGKPYDERGIGKLEDFITASDDIRNMFPVGNAMMDKYDVATYNLAALWGKVYDTAPAPFSWSQSGSTFTPVIGSSVQWP